MLKQHLALVIINVLGGIAVIGSYILGLKAQAGGANALWGAAPQGIRPAYTVSMLLSAVAYFAFIYFLLFKLSSGAVFWGGRAGEGLLVFIFLLILIPSALWMPLTNAYLSNASAGTWFSVRLVLVLVGLSSIALCATLLSLQGKASGPSYWLAVAGSAYFAFHTAILDGLVWPILFR
jgi:hypothetical protein